MTREPVVTVTEPTLESKRFEDQVRVIRIFNPNEEKMVSALRYILSLSLKHSAIKLNPKERTAQ